MPGERAEAKGCEENALTKKARNEIVSGMNRRKVNLFGCYGRGFRFLASISESVIRVVVVVHAVDPLEVPDGRQRLLAVGEADI